MLCRFCCRCHRLNSANRHKNIQINEQTTIPTTTIKTKHRSIKKGVGKKFKLQKKTPPSKILPFEHTSKEKIKK